MSRPTVTFRLNKEPEPERVPGSGKEQYLEQGEWLRLTQYSLDHFPEMAIWTDMEAHILYVNQETCTRLGYTRDELQTMSIPDIDQDHPWADYAAFIAFIKERKSTIFESMHIPKTGRLIPVEVSAHYLRYGDKEYIISFGRDISRRKTAEDALRESEARYRSLVEEINDMVWVLDKDATLMYVSPQTQEMMGYSPAELIGKTPFDFIYPEDIPKVKKAITEAVRERKPWSLLDYRVLRKDGRIFYMETNGKPIIDSDGRLKGFRGINRDVTARRQAEEALREAKARAELYLDLMSHDINNMNQIGIGFLELLLGSPRLEEPERELLEKSLESLEGSTRLIDNVQKLQKVSSGWLQREEVDVGQVLDRVKTYYTGAIGRGRIDYAPAACCKVMANELLYDVFSNLVGNAMKHSVGGEGPRVSIRVSKTEEAGKEYCRVAVEDRGPGIPDELKDKIFDRLHRGTTRVRGKGLGLYLVKSLVQSYGGRTWVEDRVPGDPSQGSRFVVVLPAKE